jgi:hypothetical protein
MDGSGGPGPGVDGGPGGGGDGSSTGGRCRLDIVFSIDPSGSMTEELRYFREMIFPELARALRDNPSIENFRVGLMDSCWSPPEFHVEGRGGACPFSSAQPWMESVSPDLVTEFACVGDMHGEGDSGYRDVSDCTGSGSDNEHPATAAMYAVEAAAAGTAQSGFLRDDALLVVFALTDEDEQPENGPGPLTPEQIHHRIVAVKGNPRNVAFLGVGGNMSCDGVYGSADEATVLKRVTSQFAAWDRGLFWDLCGGNLSMGLASVIDLLELACGELMPPCSEFMPGADWTACYPDPGEPPPDQPPLI